MDVRLVGISLNQALEILENEEADIYMEPPENATAVITDEDSGEDDGGGTFSNLPGRLLRTRVEAIARSQKIGCPIDDDTDSEAEPEIKQRRRVKDKDIPDAKATSRQLRSRAKLTQQCEASSSEEDVPAQKTRPENKKTKKKEALQYVWEKEDLPSTKTMFPEPDYSALRDLSLTEIFELFYDDELCQYLADETNKYATQSNHPNPAVTKEEIRVFLAIHILSGYSDAPTKRGFWEDAIDTHKDIACNAMRRNRFLDIVRFIHCADNSEIDKTDKMYKVRPLIERVNKNCIQQYRPEENTCFDESMVPYFGPHGCKQFIRGKPIRFGFKAWCFCSSTGYLICFDFYQGTNPKANSEYETLYGKCAAPLVCMIDSLPPQVRELPFHVTLDNLFTGMHLLTDMKKRGYNMTGTIRENRIPKNCDLKPSKQMGKQCKRGEYDYRKSSDGILIVRWVDNAVVTVASTSSSVAPVGNATRYSASEKKVVQVTRPNTIAQYNKYIGGVDLMDHGIARLRMKFRKKKWWWCLFAWMLEVCLHNGWMLAKLSGHNISQVDFHRHIVQTYLVKYMRPPNIPRRRAITVSKNVLNDIRYDGLNHLVAYFENDGRGLCQGNYCNSKCRTQCVKCNVAVCVKCFVDFHVA